MTSKQASNSSSLLGFQTSSENEDEQKVMINKGHFNLDTEERTAKFSQYLSEGWEDDYREYRKLWEELPRTSTVREYPLLIDLELASVCNLNCPMCYTITDEFKNMVKKGLMDFDLFKKIIDEVAGKVYSVRLSFRGEPTLHKKMIECTEYAKSKGIQEVSTLTNGSKLNGDFAKRLIDAGIDWITVSIDGMGETYNKIRKPITFDKIVSNLREIKEHKASQGLNRPVVKAQGVWPAIRNSDPEGYYNALAEVTDLIAYNPLIDCLRNDDDIVYEDDFSCPQFYQRIVIGSDGRAMACSNDEEGQEIVGDAYKQSIHDIWHSKEVQRIRDIHSKPNGFKDINVCKQCYYPRKSVPDEEATVNGRKVIIHNYINRAQEIGM